MRIRPCTVADAWGRAIMRTTGAMRGVGAAALLVLLVGAGCGDSGAKKKTEIRPVRTVVVDPKPIDDDRQAVGEVRARYESDLGFRVSGKVVARLVDIGVSVKKGDVLARLDEQDYRNKLKSAEADIAAAEAVLDRSAGRRGAPAPAARHPARPRAPTTIPRSRTCARPKPSSTPPRRRAIWPRTSSAMPSCVADFDGIVTAVGAEAGPGRQRRPDDRPPGAPDRQGCASSPSPSRRSADGRARRAAGDRSWRC